MKRTQRPSPLPLSVLAACLFAACGAEEQVLLIGNGAGVDFEALPDGGVPSVLDQLPPNSQARDIVEGYNQLLSLAEDRADYFCECEHQTTEGEEFELCLRDLNPQNPPPVLECTRRVLSESPHVLPGLECEREINQAYIDCIRSAPNCLDFDYITDCEINRITDGLECEEFPYDVWFADQKRCWGNDRPPPFECDNGKTISSDLVCDIVDDCGDRSDESQCANDPHAGVDL